MDINSKFSVTKSTLVEFSTIINICSSQSSLIDLKVLEMRRKIYLTTLNDIFGVKDHTIHNYEVKPPNIELHIINRVKMVIKAN
jgi:hypothetical protein